jgi:hypothetical protein
MDKTLDRFGLRRADTSNRVRLAGDVLPNRCSSNAIRDRGQLVNERVSNMFDELEQNKRRTLMREWHDVAESSREDTSRRAQAIEDEARAEAEAAAAPEEARRRAINAQAWANALSARHPVSAVDRAEIRERRERKIAREAAEAEEVRAWVAKRNAEDYQRSQPVGTPTTARAESGGDDGWGAWNRWADSRIERHLARIEAQIEKQIERRVDEKVRDIYSDMTQLATNVRKTVNAMADAINKHSELIRELGKRGEPDARPDSQRALRVVN